MPPSPGAKAGFRPGPEPRRAGRLGLLSGVYIPVCLNIMSILMFLRFGLVLGQVGLVGFLALLVTACCVDLLTTFSLSAIASNGEVKGGGAYYLISRSLGPEFGGSIGVLFFLAQALNTAMNVVGLIDCIRLNLGPGFLHGYWAGYGLQTAALALCTGLCLLGSATFSKASNALLAVLTLALVSIPISALFKAPFHDEATGIEFTGPSLDTLVTNSIPRTGSAEYHGLSTFRALFGILFPATSGIFAGASMSGDLKNPSKAIPKGTLSAMLTTFVVYFVVVLSMASTTTHESLLANANVVSLTNLSPLTVLAGECAVTIFSALMGIIGASKLFQALARDELLPGLSVFGMGSKKNDEPILAIFLTYAIAQVALLADLNQIATLISMGFQMTFFVMNLACFLLKIGSAPNFRPSFKFFSWQTALIGSLLSAAAMFFIDATYAAIAICALIFVFLLIHYLSPPKRWGDVSQNLIYHQVRKYLLRLKPEHIKFWRPHIMLLINNPRRQTRLIQFCNSMKKGSLYILGHVIVTDDFDSGVHEARLQQHAWTNYISEYSRIKAFLQLTMSPSITWGIRNLVLSAGLGGMRPNIAVLGFYNMEDLRKSNPVVRIPSIPASPAQRMRRPPRAEDKAPRRRRVDTSARLLERDLPTDVIRTEGMMSPTDYMTVLEDLALKYRLNVAVAHGFDSLETPRRDGSNTKKYVDLWPIQMCAELSSDGKNVLTTNFDTYTLILQLGHILHSVQNWSRAYSLRVMVFVEYETEVEEESARVKALLEKLRIDAKVLVFWLAAGNLHTYELIINGKSNDIDNEIVVNETLKDETWWDELQAFRGRSSCASSQDMSHLRQILTSSTAVPGVRSPHGEEGFGRRRSRTADVSKMPKHPGIATLSKMGVNVGIYTHHLGHDVVDDPGLGNELYSDSEWSDTDEDDLRKGESVGFVDESGDPMRRPLLAATGQRAGAGRATAAGERKPKAAGGNAALPPTYGSMSTFQTLVDKQEGPASQSIPEVREISSSLPREGDQDADDKTEAFPDLEPLEALRFPDSASRLPQPMSPTRVSGTQTPRDGTLTPIRPSLSRQPSATRFSSRPVPETRVTTEADGSRICFAPEESATPRVERPTFSRQSSYGKFSSRLVPETRVDVGEEAPRTIQFAEQQASGARSASHSRHHSRQGSQMSAFMQGGVSLDIPELVEAYKNGSAAGNDSGAGSVYSTQSVALSFNDLPSRAQHLILNELMRQHSKDTAVLLSTLPIPCEGASLDEAATIQYLSDVEILCNELPPTLMVLSNNMTVTVSL